MSSQLKALRMSGLPGTVNIRNKQAIEQQFSYEEFLAMVLQDEYESSNNKEMKELINYLLRKLK